MMCRGVRRWGFSKELSTIENLGNDRNSPPGRRSERRKKVSTVRLPREIACGRARGVIFGVEKRENLKYLENVGELKKSKEYLIPQCWDALFTGMRGFSGLNAYREIQVFLLGRFGHFGPKTQYFQNISKRVRN